MSAEGREENQECGWNALKRAWCCHSYSMLQVKNSMILVKLFKEEKMFFEDHFAPRTWCPPAERRGGSSEGR